MGRREGLNFEGKLSRDVEREEVSFSLSSMLHQEKGERKGRCLGMHGQLV
jgi:hypothetical protein